MSRKEYNDLTDIVHVPGAGEKALDRIEAAANGPLPDRVNGQYLADSEESPGAVSPPGISEQVIGQLPNLLQVGTGFMEGENEQSVFLTGALPIIAACMPNVLICNSDGYLSPNIYTATFAGAGQGKGSLRFARRLAEPTDNELYENSRSASREWQDRKSRGEDPGPKPTPRQLAISANSSARAMVDALAANDGNGIIADSEMKTANITGGNEWGNYRDVLLKSAHGESVSIDRKGGERVRIRNPRLSVAMTGTFSAFSEFFRSMEDGLFSRFNFFTFTAPLQWQSQRPGVRNDERERFFEEAGGELKELYGILNSRAEPLYVWMEDDDWNAHDALFSSELSRSPGEFAASVKRAGVTAVRVAAILAVLRAFENGQDLAHAKSITISSTDARSGLKIAHTWLAHARYLTGYLPISTTPTAPGADLPEDKQLFRNELARLGGFTYQDAVSIAERLGIEKTDRTIRTWITEIPGIVKVSRGRYKVVETKNFHTSGTSTSSDTSVPEGENGDYTEAMEETEVPETGSFISASGGDEPFQTNGVHNLPEREQMRVRP